MMAVSASSLVVLHSDSLVKEEKRAANMVSIELGEEKLNIRKTSIRRRAYHWRGALQQ